MRIIVNGLALLALFGYAPAFAQEGRHDPHKGQTEAAPAKPGTTKCCEGMDEMKAGMPMKGEMNNDIKAKMEKMREMKEKRAEKMHDGAMKMQTKEGKYEKGQPTKDEHQH